MKICFPLIAQVHQAFHSLPIALELAQRHPQVEVHVAATLPANLAYCRDLARRYYPDAETRVQWRLLPLPDLLRGNARGKPQELPPKTRTLLWNIAYLRRFDALVMPERTSLGIRRLLPRRTKLIWTRHGAGDRAGGFTPEIAALDFVLMSGGKIEQRLLEKGLIRPGHYATGVYAKFDLVRRMERRRLFDNDRPTVVYNPHFLRYSSWPQMGTAVLDRFAASTRYNLVFAPHIRLFYPVTAETLAPFARYEGLPHMRIDLGSEASADMTYTLAADCYLGDVSSQATEFVSLPRPAVFLNPQRLAWSGDPDFRFWELGPVVEDVADLDAALAASFADFDTRWRPLQEQYRTDTFGTLDGPTAPHGADAIVDFLRRS